jgi:hypothetical protein
VRKNKEGKIYFGSVSEVSVTWSLGSLASGGMVKQSHSREHAIEQSCSLHGRPGEGKERREWEDLGTRYTLQLVAHTCDPSYSKGRDSAKQFEASWGK